MKLYEDLTQELNFNLLFAPIGHLTLAHTDTSLSGLRLRAEVNKQLGLESYLVDIEELKDLETKLKDEFEFRHKWFFGKEMRLLDEQINDFINK